MQSLVFGDTQFLDFGSKVFDALLWRKMSDAKLFANRSALFANDAESAMIACSLL